MSNMTKTMAVFSGSAHPELAREIANALGVELGDIHLEKFANGEIYARYNDSIRGADVFLIQSVAGESVNDALMELLIMADAAKRASARTVTAVISHYGYSRQDRKASAREPITAKLVANMLTARGRSHHHDRSSSGPDPGLLRIPVIISRRFGPSPITSTRKASILSAYA